MLIRVLIAIISFRRKTQTIIIFIKTLYNPISVLQCSLIVTVEVARIFIMSYLEMKKESNIRFDSLSAEDLSIKNIMNTMKNMYLNGANDMDIKWRYALEQYSKKHNIQYKDIFCEILNILNNK